MVQLICALALTWGTSSFGFDSTHAAWGKWLHDFTTENGPNTEVDYAKAKATPAPLTAYLKTLSDVTAAEYAAWPVNGRMAFLINSYNAFAIQLVVDHYPIGSIKELGNLLNNPWTKKFFQLLGKKQSLDGIEHGILRRDFTEPRALLALVSVSKGSPPLRSEPYVAGTLETQLDEAARRFIGDGLRNRYVAKDGKVYLSRVFDWYAGDFVKKFGSLQAFVAPYFVPTVQEQAAVVAAGIAFLEFDWRLNELPQRSVSSRH